MVIPPISVLRAFEATVRHSSVKRAAAEIHVTDGAVSRAIREMERHVGQELFRRANRSVDPTAAAIALAEGVRAGLSGISSSLNRARRVGHAATETLVLSCEPTLLIRWLIPRLVGLQEALGERADLRLVSAGGPVAFARDRIDLAIRRADFPLSVAIRHDPFLRERIGPVCRPDIAAALAAGEPLRAPVLHSQTRPGAWNDWAVASRRPLDPGRELHFEHFYQSLQAARAGMGVAIGPIALVADDLAAGVLVAPFGFIADQTDYVLMAPERVYDPDLYAVVLTWLREAAADLDNVERRDRSANELEGEPP